jgi:hypothetical protein
MPLICTKNNALSNKNKSVRQQEIDTGLTKCRKYNNSVPNIMPVILSLSNTISGQGVYQMIYINGYNFLPYDTTVSFGNMKNISVVFYSSNSVSFVVPLNVAEGNYEVQVIINYFNTRSKTSSNLYSNKLNYTIQNYVITSNYKITDSNKYNTIIQFITSGTILFYKTFYIAIVVEGGASVIVNGAVILSGTYKIIPNIDYYINIGSGSVVFSFDD